MTLFASSLTLETSFGQVNINDHKELKEAYLGLYNEYKDLSEDFRSLYDKYKILFYEYESLTIDYQNTLSILRTTEILAERQAGTILNMKGEITSLLALVEDLRRQKNPLLNFTIDGFAGYSGQFFLHGGATWMPLQKGWFRAGLFGELGYVFLDGFAYRFGIKFQVSVFGD